MADLIQIRRDTYDNWWSTNPTLANGEVGIITHASGSGNATPLNPLQCKVGDGSTNWRNLATQAWAEPGLSGSINQRINQVSGSLHTEVNLMSGSLESLEDNIGHYTCTDQGNIVAKTVSASNYTRITGGAFKVKFNYKHTATSGTVTLKVGNAAAANLYYDGAPVTNLNTWEAGETVDVYFDGQYYMTNNVSGGGTFATGQKVKNVGIDDEPTAGSDNLVKSSGIYPIVEELDGIESTVEVVNNSQIRQELPYLKNGYEIEIVLISDSVTPVSVSFYTSTNNHVIQNLGIITSVNGVIRKTLTADAEQIYSYNDSGYGNYSYIVRRVPIKDKIKDLESEIDEISSSIDRVQDELALGAVYDVSAKNPTSGPNNDGKWESLSALLSDANLNTLIPTSVRKGGMSIRFVCSSDNNYVQYMYEVTNAATSTTFKNVDNWEKTNLKEEVSQLEQEVFQGIFKDTNAETNIYANDVSELYLLVKLTSSVQNISLKCYNGNLIFRALPNNIFTCQISSSDYTENNVVYTLKVTSTTDSVNYPEGKEIAYIVFKDITHFKANPYGEDNLYLNLEYIQKLYLQPIIYKEKFEGTLIDAQAKTKDTNQSLFQIRYGKNRCKTVYALSGYFIRRTSGVVSSGGSSDYKGVTGYIKVSKNGLICNNAGNSGEGSGWAAYRLATEEEIADSSIRKFSINEKDYVYSHGSPYPGSAKIYTYQEGDEYVRFTLFETANTQVEEGTVETAYEPYSYSWDYNEEMIPDRLVTVDNIEPTEIEVGENLCNPETCILRVGAYIDAANGKQLQSENPSSVFKGVTDYIPIDENGLYCNKSLFSGTHGGYAYYSDKSESSYINGSYAGHQITGGTEKFANFISGAKYVRFTLNSTDSIMVSSGSEAKEYQAYTERKVISKEILPTINIPAPEINVPTLLNGVEIQLPSEIFVTKGDNLQVFYTGCVKCRNPKLFDITASCKKGYSYYGQPYPRYFQLDTTNSSINIGDNFTLTVNVKDNEHRVVATGNTTVKVIGTMTEPNTNKNILMVGASTLQNGEITGELYRRLCKSTGDDTFKNPTGLNLNNISFVGSMERKPTTYPGVYQEDHSGKGWFWYATNGDVTTYRFFCNPNDIVGLSEGDKYTQGNLLFTVTNDINTNTGVFTAHQSGSGTVVLSNGTLTLSQGNGPQSIQYSTAALEGDNPFWYNGGLDFNHYANESSTHCNGSIDVLVACLAGNDIYQVSQGFGYVKETYIKPFLNAFHTDFPNAKVIIYTPPMLRFDACAKEVNSNYWTKAVAFWEYAKGYEDLLSEEFSSGHEYSEFVYISGTTYEFDNEHLYWNPAKDVCNRSSVKEYFGTDNLHYEVEGCYTVSDTLYHIINRVLGNA